MQLPLSIDVRRSRRLLVWQGLAHLLAGLAILPTVLPLWTKIVLGAALFVSFVRIVRHRWPIRLILQSDGRLVLADRDGEEFVCHVHPATVVLRRLVVLLLVTPTGRRALTLPVDALGGDEHRQLRLWLKWKARPGAA